MIARTERIHRVYSYFVVDGVDANALVVRADHSVTVSTLLSVGCSQSNFIAARVEMDDEAKCRRASGLSDSRVRIFLCESVEELLFARERFTDDVAAGRLVEQIRVALANVEQRVRRVV